MSMLMRAARVHAWLNGRNYLLPEDIQGVFRETISHRVFLTPVYEIRRESIMTALMDQILRQVPAP